MEFNSSKVPFLSGIKLGEVGDSPLVDNALYRQLVGILLYITHYQPDLEYSVCVLARYMQESHDIYWKAPKIIFHYMKGTKHFGVHHVVGSPLELVGFYDLDCVGDPNERNSTSGFVLMLFNGPIYC